MDYRDLTNILLKISGAAIITYAIISIPTYFSYYFATPHDSFLVFVGMSVIPMLFPILAGLLFLLFPNTITNKLIKGPSEPSAGKIDIESFERIAFSVLGLYLIFRVISDLFYYGTTLLISIRSEHPSFSAPSPDHPYALIVATVAELVFALYLLLGSEGLIKLLSRIRKTGPTTR